MNKDYLPLTPQERLYKIIHQQYIVIFSLLIMLSVLGWKAYTKLQNIEIKQELWGQALHKQLDEVQVSLDAKESVQRKLPDFDSIANMDTTRRMHLIEPTRHIRLMGRAGFSYPHMMIDAYAMYYRSLEKDKHPDRIYDEEFREIK